MSRGCSGSVPGEFCPENGWHSEIIEYIAVRTILKCKYPSFMHRIEVIYKGNKKGSTWIMSWRHVLLLIGMCWHQERRILKERLDRFLSFVTHLY